MVPYFSFTLLIYALWVFGFRYYGDNVPWHNEPHLPLQNIFYGSLDKMIHLYMQLWFLPCLFLTRRLFWLFGRIPQIQSSVWNRFLLLGGCGVAGWIYAEHFSKRLFWNFDVAWVCIVFFGAGYYLKNQSWVHDPWTLKKNLTWILGCAVAQVAMVICNALYFTSKNYTLLHVDTGYGKYGHPLFFTISAFLGIIVALRLSHLIASSVTWPQMSTFIMVIYMLHMVCFEIFKIGLSASCHLSAEQVQLWMQQSFWINLLCALLSVGVLIKIAPWFRNHLPWMIGHR